MHKCYNCEHYRASYDRCNYGEKCNYPEDAINRDIILHEEKNEDLPKWIRDSSDNIICSKCHWTNLIFDELTFKLDAVEQSSNTIAHCLTTPYCPMCGSKMHNPPDEIV